MGFFDRFKKRASSATPDVSTPTYSRAPVAKRSVRLERGKAPAVSHGVVLAKGGVTLAKKFESAGISLAKSDLDGVRAEAVLILDHSRSMYEDYRNGTVQEIVERALGFALQIDGDGKIPVIPFDTTVRGAVEVTLENYVNVVNRKLYQPNNMGWTYLGAALQRVLEMAKTTDAPLYVIVVTDGDPNDPELVEETVRELAQYPVFLKFLAVDEVAFLDKLDNLPGRLVDNANAQYLGRNIRGIDETDFTDRMVEEWLTWIRDGKEARILSD